MAPTVKLITNRVSRQVSATDARIEQFILSLKGFLGDSLDDVLSRLSEGNTSGIESASILGGLLSELEKRGLKKEIAKIRGIYAEELRFIKDEFEEQGIKDTFSAVDKETVDALIGIQSNKATNTLERFGIDVQSQVMTSVIAGQKPDLRKIQKDLTPKLEANLRTEIGTAVMAFNRTVTALKAEELGLNLFLYVGPDDKVTRPFCHRVLVKNPPIYTREEIDAMPAQQGLSVFTYGGGYNCRHHWRAITKELAEQLGYRI